MQFPLPGDSPQIKLVNELAEAVKEMNLDVLKKTFHKDFRRVIYPRSLGLPEQNKEECIKFVAGLMSFATAFEFTVHSFTDAPGRVIVHTTPEVKNTFGKKMIWETMVNLHIVTDEDGSLKIKQIDEFDDSKVFGEVNRAMVAAIATTATHIQV